MGEKKVLVGEYLGFIKNDEARERTGKKVPDKLKIKVGKKEIEIGCFNGMPDIVGELEAGEKITLSCFVNGDYVNLNDKEEDCIIRENGKGDKEEEEPDEMPQEEDKKQASRPKKIEYRNYRIEKFNEAFQDAKIVVAELAKTDTSVLAPEAQMQITKALFYKACLEEKEYSRK